MVCLNTNTQKYALGGKFPIRLLGSPSPSSEVTNGYIRFVGPQEIRTPTYIPERKQINIWVNKDYLPMTLAQMQHSQRYLWGNGRSLDHPGAFGNPECRLVLEPRGLLIPYREL